MPHSFGRKTWSEFVETLSDTECQYTAFDLEYCLDPKARLGSKKRRIKHSHVLLTVPKRPPRSIDVCTPCKERLPSPIWPCR